ncbi:unnamed protein product [Natator depressus]
MGCENGSEISEFILLGLSSRPGPQPFLALLFLPLYVAGVLGNSLMVALTMADPRFHSPMYSLLRSLSLVDVGLLSVTVPQAPAHALSGCRAGPFRACLAQFFFFYLFGISWWPRPWTSTWPSATRLRYPAVMSPRVCRRLVASCLGLAVLHTALHAGLLLRRSHRGGNRLPHVFRHHQPLLRLSCSPTRVNEAAIFFDCGLVILGPFLFITAPTSPQWLCSTGPSSGSTSSPGPATRPPEGPSSPSRPPSSPRPPTPSSTASTTRTSRGSEETDGEGGFSQRP